MNLVKYELMPVIEKGRGSDLEEDGEFRCILVEFKVHE